MYSHYYDKLSQDHRQQLQADATMRHLARQAPHQTGLARHAVGRLGAGLVALGSRLERVEQPGRSARPRLSPVKHTSS